MKKIYNMKFLQTIAGFGAKSGGTSTCTYDLVTALNQLNCQTDILTLEPNDPTDCLMGGGEQWIKALPYDGKLRLAIHIILFII